MKNWISWLIRNVVNAILYILTRKTQLQRALSSPQLYQRTLNLHQCLVTSHPLLFKPQSSSSSSDDNNNDYNNSALSLLLKQQSLSSGEEERLKESLEIVRSIQLNYNCLYQLQRTKFDHSNADHISLLHDYWSALLPFSDNKGDISWSDFGFQGKDATTDFRGSGILALHHLSFFAHHYPSAYLHTLHISTPLLLPHAVVGIQITYEVMKLYGEGELHYHFYSELANHIPLNLIIPRLYVFIVKEFIEYYKSQRPKDVMEYSMIKTRYLSSFINAKLRLPPFILFSNTQFEHKLHSLPQ